MNINLVSYTSSLDKLTLKHQVHEELLNELELNYSVNYFSHAELDKVPFELFSILFIATGGVEHLIIKDIERLPRPIILLTDGLQNSLPAALEVSTWLRKRGIKNEILHGDFAYIKKRIDTLALNFKAQQTLKNEHIAILGSPSPWLLSSGVDYYLVKQRWGLNFTNIPMSKVYTYFEAVTVNDVKEEVEIFKNNALGCKGVNDTAILNSMRFYKAVKRLCQEDGFTALSMNCYKALEDIGVTGCLANSLLNNEGIIAGCEGDLQALFTLLVIKNLTGQIGYMCNPNSIDIHNNQLILGHCSIPTSQVQDYIIRDHFASKKTVSIQGIVPLGEATIAKCAGECLDEFFVSSGSILDNTSIERSSRTEVLFKQKNPVSYFLKNPLGNHHILVRGNHEEALKSFLETYSCKRFE